MHKPALAAAICFVVGGARAASDLILYRCPGPPVEYKFNLRPEEVKQRGCAEVRRGESAAHGKPATQVEPSPLKESAVPAPNWIALGKDDNSCSDFWDRSTLSVRGQLRKAWFMRSCERLQPAGDGTSYQSQLTYVHFDCAERSFRVAQEIRHLDAFGSGKVLGSTTFEPGRNSFISAAPNTVASSWVQVACTTRLP